jgi:hypothetical protein
MSDDVSKPFEDAKLLAAITRFVARREPRRKGDRETSPFPTVRALFCAYRSPGIVLFCRTGGLKAVLRQADGVSVCGRSTQQVKPAGRVASTESVRR